MIEAVLVLPFCSIVVFLLVLIVVEKFSDNRGSIQLPTHTVKNTMIERYSKKENPWDDIAERHF